MSTLFETQAPRPLADRLRPRRLADIVGQIGALADLNGVAVQRQGRALAGEHEVHPGVDVGRRAVRLQHIRRAVQGYTGVGGGRVGRVPRPGQQLDGAGPPYSVLLFTLALVR